MRLKALFLGAIALIFFGCSSSRSMVSKGVDLGTYREAAILPAEEASFAELELEDWFQSLGYTIIGYNEALGLQPGECLLVNYTWKIIGTSCYVTISLTDANTRKNLAAFQGTGNGPFIDTPNRNMANVAARKEMAKVLKPVGKP